MNQHKTVLLLPLAVMVLLFVFGYMQFTTDEAISHLDLQEHTTLNSIADGDRQSVEWQWERYPEGTLFGDDYIEIAFPEGVEVEEAYVELTSRNEVIYSVRDWFETGDNRIAIPFPNRMIEQDLYGPSGEVIVTFNEEVPDQISVYYVHTWMDVDVSKSDGPSLEERFEDAGMINYWRIGE
ncbi:hypothetical protein [Salisediminibacterium selenitireducens]|uniref:Uncharacterized protein n=1 Tax=Bacillus selenitireducens (strain ATCC 700615 / DSM 15326 / MLS10) TaxID=439292 RepID=D6XW53_BACIE|nr:hypothetical protein [Salisediminibacterium selenitireducens]ADH99807.1 hypothetical protein Bsel_2304 [[Bacillus] selenitireducens MLS10]